MVTRKGSALMLGNEQFRFASYNTPGFLLVEDRVAFSQAEDPHSKYPRCSSPASPCAIDTSDLNYGYSVNEKGQKCICDQSKVPLNSDWVPNTLEELEDVTLSINGSAGRVLRTYTLGVGKDYHVTGLRQYNENAFVAMDQALAMARKHNVRVIVPIVNNNWDGETGRRWFGNLCYFTELRSLPCSSFYTNPDIRQDLKHLITFILNRRNTVNGILYSEDAAVLAWQLGNELGGGMSPLPPDDWKIDIASHIKSLTKTLVMDGTANNWADFSLRITPDVLSHPSIDIFSNHYYAGGKAMIDHARQDAAYIAGGGKVFLVAEIGFRQYDVEPVFDHVLQNKDISGVLVWSLRYHARDGGFYTHAEDPNGQNFPVHIPEFDANTAIGFGPDDKTFSKMIREYGLKMAGLDPSLVKFPLPVPAKPIQSTSSLPSTTLSTSNIRWFGSAWAASYQIRRRVVTKFKTEEDWVLVAANASDAFIYDAKTMFVDRSALNGVLYEYEIKPTSVDGILNHANPLMLQLQGSVLQLQE